MTLVPPAAVDYLVVRRAKMQKGDDYLEKRFGIPRTPPRAFPELSANEEHIKQRLAELLQLIDEHVAYWEQTQSLTRIYMIQDARGLVLHMIAALQFSLSQNSFLFCLDKQRGVFLPS
jgi:hypothetical protein